MSTKPPMPEQPKTTELPAVKVAVETIDTVLFELRAVRTDVSLLVDESKLTNQRLGIVERRVDDLERRTTTQSDRTRSTTENDAKQDAAIADLVVKVNAIEANQVSAAEERASTAKMVEEIRNAVVSTAGTFTRLLENKKVRAVGKVVWLAAMAYAAAKGFRVLP